MIWGTPRWYHTLPIEYRNYRAGCLLKLALKKALRWARLALRGVHHANCLSAIGMKILDPRPTSGVASPTPGTVNRPKGPFIGAIDFCPDDITAIGTQYASFPPLTAPKKPLSFVCPHTPNSKHSLSHF